MFRTNLPTDVDCIFKQYKNGNWKIMLEREHKRIETVKTATTDQVLRLIKFMSNGNKNYKSISEFLAKNKLKKKNKKNS